MPTAEQTAKEASDLRAELTAKHGQVMDTNEMRALYTVIGFAAPWVVVERKADGVKGTLYFTHMPRFYYGWAAD